MREFKDHVIKNDELAQYAEDTGITAKSPRQLFINLRAVFKYIQSARFFYSKQNAILEQRKMVFSSEPFHQK